MRFALYEKMEIFRCGRTHFSPAIAILLVWGQLD
jgi:hypothetical protein